MQEISSVKEDVEAIRPAMRHRMNKPQEWWEAFFPVWGDIQRQVKSEEATRVEADCIENLLQLPLQSQVLDVPCGDGRLAIRLASLGIRVTAVDFALPLLEEGRREASARGLEVEWAHRDMRDLPWQERFDGAYCFWGSFGYFEDAENATFLEAVCRTLKPGARFLVETHIAETLLPRFEARDWQRVGETLLLQERQYDHIRSRVEVAWTFARGGEIVERSSSIRIYTYQELCRLLEEAGFTSCEGYDGLTDQPFRLGAQRLLLVATKRA
jgi:cyclopropane fatty-acyl-phospholipid synthase-like methyltransferase